MIQRVDSGWLSARAYAKKYGLRAVTVCKWAREGEIPARRGKRQSWEIADDPPNIPMPTKPEDRVVGDTAKCGTCRRRRKIAEFFTDAGIRKGRCRECSVLMGGYLDPRDPVAISLQREVDIGRSLEFASPEVLADRERELQAHAARIEAMGLAGDGERWADDD